MDGANTLWLSASHALGGDGATFDAFRNLLVNSSGARECGDWWCWKGSAQLSELLEGAQPVPVPAAPSAPGGPELGSGRNLAHPAPETKPAIDDDGDSASEAPADDGTVLTIAGGGIGSVQFCPPQGEGCTALRAAYAHQLLLRCNPQAGELYYDCFEARPMPIKHWQWPISGAEAAKLDSQFDRAAWHEGDGGGCADSDLEDEHDPYSDSEEEAEASAEQSASALPEPGPDERKRYFFQEALAYFKESRLMRLCTALADITGMQLVAARNLAEDPEAVLILELARPPRALAFAARAAHGRRSDHNRFAPCGDWTPGAAASRAVRHYLTGSLSELREAAAHLAAAEPRLGEMQHGGAPNSLAGQELLPQGAPLLPAFSSETPPHLRPRPQWCAPFASDPLQDPVSPPSPPATRSGCEDL